MGERTTSTRGERLRDIRHTIMEQNHLVAHKANNRNAKPLGEATAEPLGKHGATLVHARRKQRPLGELSNQTARQKADKATRQNVRNLKPPGEAEHESSHSARPTTKSTRRSGERTRPLGKRAQT
eukprot:6492611-Amphidinium_carterae.2